ncbi:AraC family transcriptional regulator N-terminal domain-containing protein [Corallincola platygyrae]|uniref:AraC family transcriptional regulator N-terminal domain-containing protein n=1 Tax=Corallincola platygyrae TaxID=1193278 RepID=A0ABW4XIS3_9GAMM
MNQYVTYAGLESLECATSTTIEGVHFYRAAKSSARQPLLYQSGIIIMGQGRKMVHLGEHAVAYGPGDYLVLGVPLPLECEAIAENDQPLLGLSIDIPPALLHRLVNQLQSMPSTPSSSRERAAKMQNQCGLQSDKMDPAMLNAVERLLKALMHPTDGKILGPMIVEEIIYRILIGPQSHTLMGLAQFDGHYARIAKALTRVHSDYAQQITVDHLAEEANMSVSAFHRAFRDVTLESPLQYLKKVRLAKAKELIINQGQRAADAARQVGYVSPSQFSREFKRHFNQTPGALAIG